MGVNRDEIHVEARWTCPSTGEFISKGLVEIRKKEPVQPADDGANPVTGRPAEDDNPKHN